MLFLLFFLRVPYLRYDKSGLVRCKRHCNRWGFIIFNHPNKEGFFFRAVFQRRTMVVLHPYDFVQRSV